MSPRNFSIKISGEEFIKRMSNKWSKKSLADIFFMAKKWLFSTAWGCMSIPTHQKFLEKSDDVSGQDARDKSVF